MSTKKVISKRSLMNMSKRSFLLMFMKSVWLITFFVYIFMRLFQRIWNQREFLRFLIPFLIFSKNKFFMVILALFSNFEASRAKNGSKN
jgi:hypothetical protein